MFDCKTTVDSDSYILVRHWISEERGDVKRTDRVRAVDYGIDSMQRGASTMMLITFEGKTQSLSKWCEELQISPGTLSNRLHSYGWTIRKAFTTPLLIQSELELTFGGLTLTAKEWARRTGLKRSTILYRHRKGLPVEEILSLGPSGKKIEHKGESHTIKEWAEITGIKRSTISKRLCDGWSVEEALETKTLPSPHSRHSKKKKT